MKLGTHFDGVAHSNSVGGFVDEVGGVEAKNVNTQNLARVRSIDQLVENH